MSFKSIVLLAIVSLVYCREMKNNVLSGEPHVFDEFFARQLIDGSRIRSSVPQNTIVVERPQHYRPGVHVSAPGVSVQLGHPKPQHYPHEPCHHIPHPIPPKHCEVLRRKGDCVSATNFFHCIRDGGLLAPDVAECPLSQACCIKNFMNQRPVHH